MIQEEGSFIGDITEESQEIQEIFQGMQDQCQGKEDIQEKIEEEVIQGEMIEEMIEGVLQGIEVKRYTRSVLHVGVKNV